MTWLDRLPIRARITAAFAGVMALFLAGICVSVYFSMSRALLDEIDSGLRFRAAATDPASPHASVEAPNPRLVQHTEAFDQLLTRGGRVLRSSPGLPRRPLLGVDELAEVDRPIYFERHVSGVQDTARLLALPVGGASTNKVLVVGTTMADRTDALRHLMLVFATSSPIAIVLASVAGWVVAGLGLRPVERIRRQASAITASGLDRRLDVPRANDELHRLGITLNEMLDRLETAASNDRRFLERASHELRAPLTALQAELDVAVAGPQDAATLAAAIASATEETERLSRLASDLLALARTFHGRMPIRRDTCSLRKLLEAAAAAAGARAHRQAVSLTVSAPDVTVQVDAMRLRQALDNLLDNALRHTPPGGTISITGATTEDSVSIEMRDDGSGFASLREARSVLASQETGPPGSGLGLRIANTVAASHGGDLRIDNHAPHGATVTITLHRMGAATALNTGSRAEIQP